MKSNKWLYKDDVSIDEFELDWENMEYPIKAGKLITHPLAPEVVLGIVLQDIPEKPLTGKVYLGIGGTFNDLELEGANPDILFGNGMSAHLADRYHLVYPNEDLYYVGDPEEEEEEETPKYDE